MTHLYLIRHADYIYAEQDGKKRDLGLSPAGIAQAERLRDRLARSGEKGLLCIHSPFLNGAKL